ncbi:MAG: hypothetical protein KKF30_02900 [Proteobacteria bacterium]|nr:hypothetical protein [Pseudomonadota bacterium]MBU4471293.1 hypothetical protein [Pseudomonadota bacterium]MCG2751702.1 hypothetical protein [Desulfobacteraceae bacterium]
MAGNSTEMRLKRPLLINILIGIHSVFSLFIIATVFAGFIGQMIYVLKFMWSMLFIIILFSSIMGMWEGRPYGWWCSIFLYTPGTLQNASSIILGVSKVITVDILLGVFKLIILALLFKMNHIKYFKIESISIPMALTKVSIASILFIGAMFLIFGISQT